MKKIKNIRGNEDSTKKYFVKANFDNRFYQERTNRNLGWITEKEQKIIYNSTVGIAGCGGMGGLLASILVRLGVGNLKIADTEVFDESNINRQYGATKSTIGKSKALITAKMLREIADDYDLTIFPMGITENTCKDFVDENTLICDEIEFWALGSKILLHQEARKKNIPILSCNTVGHQTNLMYFDSESIIEESFGYSLEEAMEFQKRIQSGLATKEEIVEVLDRIRKTLVPDTPNYNFDKTNYNILESVLNRLKEKGSASIIATNPPFASGFLANHVLFQLLKESEVERNIVFPPKFPGYLNIDSALMKIKIVE